MLTRPELESRLTETMEGLGKVVGRANAQPLHAALPAWLGELRQLQERVAESPEVAVSFLGGVGAGKTTLINAILGEKILPTSQNKACTSVVCEIVGADEPTYHATVAFLSRDEWNAEVQRAKADLAAHLAQQDDRTEKQKADGSIRTAAEQKLRAVYQLDKDTEPQSLLRQPLAEPEEIRQALDVGSISFDAAKPTAFAKQVRRYLVADDQFWPIVKSVSIRGPFANLRGGIRLIDLPGVDDPNEAREAVARNFLKESQFVWIVSRIRTFLSKHMAELFETEDFFRDLLMTGKTERLAFVGTQADSIDVDEARDELGLDEETPVDDVVAANNEKAKAALHESLTERAFSIAEQYGEDRARGRQIAERLRRAPVFTVSARDFVYLQTKKGDAKLKSADRTELPALLAYLAELAKSHGLERHLCQIAERQELILQDAQRQLDALRIQNEQRRQLTAQQRQEVHAAATSALTRLDARLKDFVERYAQDLSASRELLTERFKRGTLLGRQEVDKTVATWSMLHHNTLSAVCRYGGRFSSAAGKRDFPLDLTRPILNAIAFAWDEFFGEKIGTVLKSWYDKLLQLARDHAREFVDTVYRQLKSDSSLRPDLQKLEDATAKVLAEQLALSKEEMKTRIEQTRRTLHERIPERVRLAMKSAFDLGGKVTGTGMRDIIIERHLRPAAQATARDVFTEAEEEIGRELRGLQDTLIRDFEKMAETVRRHAKQNADNFWHGARELSLEGVEQEKQRLQAAADLLKALMTR